MIAMKHAYLESDRSFLKERESLSLSSVKPLIKILMLDQVSLPALLEGTGVDVEDFTRPGKRITNGQYHHLVANACRLSKDTSFALRLGEQSCLHNDGLLAGRIMSSENVEQAMELLTRYQPLFSQSLKFEFSVDENGGVLKLLPLFDLGEALPYFIEYAFSVIYSLGRFFLGGVHFTQEEAEFHVTYPKPASSDFYQEFLSVPVRFNSDANRIMFSRELLAMPLIFSDRESAKTRDRICRARVSEIAPDNTVLDRVKFIIHKDIQSDLSLEQVAESLCISPRTLRRHLQLQRTSYKTLVEAERKRLSLAKIKKPEVSIENLAISLGYADASSFSRAFKRWYGVSPKSYREALGC